MKNESALAVIKCNPREHAHINTDNHQSRSISAGNAVSRQLWKTPAIVSHRLLDILTTLTGGLVLVGVVWARAAGGAAVALAAGAFAALTSAWHTHNKVCNDPLLA